MTDQRDYKHRDDLMCYRLVAVYPFEDENVLAETPTLSKMCDEVRRIFTEEMNEATRQQMIQAGMSDE